MFLFYELNDDVKSIFACMFWYDYVDSVPSLNIYMCNILGQSVGIMQVVIT